MPALAVRRDLSAEELRRLARREPERREPDRRAAMRLLAIANALGGLSRAEAARSAGMERQAPRDAVPRYNAEGVDGRHGRPRPGRPEGSLPGQQAALKARALRGPGPERGGVSAWRLVDIRAHAGEAHGARCATAAGAWRARSSASGSRARRPGRATPRAARPRGPRSKNGLGSRLAAIAEAHPDARLQLRCEDG